MRDGHSISWRPENRLSSLRKKSHIAYTLMMFALSFFVATQGIPANGHDACSYRKIGFDEFQPDISYYIGETADAVPWGTRVID